MFKLIKSSREDMAPFCCSNSVPNPPSTRRRFSDIEGRFPFSTSSKGTSSKNISSWKFPFSLKPLFTKRSLLVFSLFCVAGYFFYHFDPRRTKIELVYKDTPANDMIISKLSTLKDQHFYPTFYLGVPLLQGYVSSFPLDFEVLYNDRENLKLKDGGQIAIDWAGPLHSDQNADNSAEKTSKDNKILFILHGLTGGSDTNYVKFLVNEAVNKGYRVAVMNQRGINQPLTSPKPYHAGSIEDLTFALDHIKNKYPDAPIVGAGLSMGANQLLKYCGILGEKSKLDALVALSAPFNMHVLMDSIEGSIYENVVMENYLDTNIFPHLDIYKELEKTHGINMDELRKLKSIRNFHDSFTCKIFNYKDTTEFFDSTRILDSHVSNIQIPTLIMHSRDDPICNHDSIPLDKVKSNPNIIYAGTGHGAHLCWFTGFFPRRWYAEPTLEFLDIVLSGEKGFKHQYIK
jgi:predicted alpha/beta-fold hydrolase